MPGIELVDVRVGCPHCAPEYSEVGIAGRIYLKRGQKKVLKCKVCEQQFVVGFTIKKVISRKKP